MTTDVLFGDNVMVTVSVWAITVTDTLLDELPSGLRTVTATVLAVAALPDALTLVAETTVVAKLHHRRSPLTR